MATALAVRLLDLADRALRTWGACPDVADLYRAAAAALADAGQSYLSSVATGRATLTDSLC